ncbi:NADPH-dependent methylglyoxal reductase GRE2 protein [Ceratobasidium sp. AG-Ba]|nr:NADPH-dependent methylglyoxal reductase GRE2 protein [Ceratobasidium sp. AG-Ba]
MPAISPPAKILLTGASGYLGTYVVKDLLKRSYIVVGTVRSASKGDELIKLFSQYGDRISYVIVEDMAAPNAFDPIIKEGNFDGVAHTASPISHSSGSTPDTIIRPAVDGTLNLLNSIKAYGSSVKRFILTSSCGAAQQSEKGNNETTWNERILKVYEDKGADSGHPVLYLASKILAEKAAIKFVQENSGEIGFDLVSVLPAWILGAPIFPAESLTQLTSTNVVLRMIAQPRSESELDKDAFLIIHAADVAALHGEAFGRPDAAGHRIIAAATDGTWQGFYDALNDEPAFSGVPKGNIGLNGRPDVGCEGWDNSYAKKILGREFIGLKQTIRETEEYYRSKGWSFFTK